MLEILQSELNHIGIKIMLHYMAIKENIQHEIF